MSDDLGPEDKIVFAVSEPTPGDAPLVVLGIPRGAWLYMKDGKTHTFDLTKVGLPIKLMLFGAPSATSAMQTLQEGIAAQGKSVLDMRDADFSVRPKGEKSP